MENAVELHNVSMRFNLAREKVDNLKEYFVRMLKGKSVDIDEFWAVKDVSFTIPEGESFALIGANGSGKSTTLKIISGILSPTKGNVIVNGSIAPLIELGAGFDMELSGSENIFLNGAILGFSKKEMQEKYAEIVDFSELGEFIEVPVKNYSSGMIARLGFSCATTVRPEILIVDEILGVGDHHFQEKCSKRMEDMMGAGTTVILVSHSEADVRRICKKAAWIDHGKLMFLGASEEALDRYNSYSDSLSK
jgi:ABC-type polysaccharide/polyol phosphate transport system ATPase subunit